jgi:hypothetical protein
VLTRLFADLWHAGTHLNLPSSYINARAVSWMPAEPNGLDLRPSGGDGNWELRRFGEVRAAATLPNPHSPVSRYLYFNVDDAFAYGLLGKLLLLRITYRDAGCSSLAVEYDSTVSEGPFGGAFRPAGSAAVTDSGQWKTAEFRLPDCCFMNRANGADLRLVAGGGQMKLAVSQLTLEKTD